MRLEPGYSFRTYSWTGFQNPGFFADRGPATPAHFTGWAVAPSFSLFHRPSGLGLRYAPSLRYDSRNSIVDDFRPQPVGNLRTYLAGDVEWRFFHDHEVTLFTQINRAKKPDRPWQLGLGLSYLSVNAGYEQTLVFVNRNGSLAFVPNYVNLARQGYHLWARLPLPRVLGFPTPGLQLEPKLLVLPQNYPGLRQVMFQCRAVYPLAPSAGLPPRTAPPAPANGWTWWGLVGLTGRRVQGPGELGLIYPQHLVESHTLLGRGVGLDLGLAVQQRRWGLGLQYSLTVRSEPSRFLLPSASPLRDSAEYRITPQRDVPTLVLDHELTLLKAVGRQGIRLGLGHAWLNAGQVVQVRNIVQPGNPEVLNWEMPVGMRAWQLLAQLPLPKLFTLPTPGLRLEPKFYYVYHNHPSQQRSVPPLALGLKVFYQFTIAESK
jgi:hypothetical protein